MSKQYVVVIQESWESLRAVGNEAGVMLLYYVLRRAPAVHGLLSGSMEASARQLMDTVSFVVDELQHLDQLVPLVREHGMHHAERGIGVTDYRAIRESLLLTLEYCLGDSYTTEVEEAWKAACNILARLALGAVGEQRMMASMPVSAAA